MRDYLYSGVAFAALVVFTSSASAQQSVQHIELETIRVEGRSGKAAGADYGDDKPTVATEAETVLTERADRQKLDGRQITNPADINKITPGASFSESTRSFNVRGLDRARVLTTVDGIPLPFLDDGARGQGSPGATGGVNSISFDSLSAVDIVKGSDSTVFGSGMLGGGVRFRTLEPDDLIEEGNSFGGLTRFGFDSRDESWRVDQALAGRVDNTFIMVQGGYRDGHELENMGDIPGPGTSRTEKNPSDYDQENLLVKLRHYTDGGHMVGFTGELFNREEDVTPLTLSPTTYDSNTINTLETNKRERLSLDYRYDGGGWLDLAEATAFWQRQELGDDFTATRLTNPAGDWRRNNTREYEIYGVNGSALKSIATDWAQHNVSFGAQVYGSNSHQYSAGEDGCVSNAFPPCSFLHTNQSDMPDTEGLTAAAFVQNEIELFDNTVRVTPGLRFDWYRQTPELTDAYARTPAFSNSGLPDESSDYAFSPKLRVETDAAENVTLFAQWAQAFRAPTVNDLYLTYGGPGTYLRIGNDDLEAETSNGFDIGALVGDDRKGGSVKLFYNRYKNFIDDEGIGTCNAMGMCTYSPEEEAFLATLGYDAADFPMGVTRSINRANVHIYGAELEGHYKFDSGWYGRGMLGAYVGEDMDLNVGLNTIPAAKLVLAAGYETEFWGVEGIFTAAAKREFTGPSATNPSSGSDLETFASETNAYQLLDFTAWWSPREVEGLTIRAGVFNIFDEEYYEDALDLTTTSNKQYYTQPGRNFRVSATYKF